MTSSSTALETTVSETSASEHTQAEPALFTVLHGNPSAHDVAALTAVFAQLTAKARRDSASGGAGERNLWGRPEDRYAPTGRNQFNPSAFKNVRYY